MTNIHRGAIVKPRVDLYRVSISDKGKIFRKFLRAAGEFGEVLEIHEGIYEVYFSTLDANNNTSGQYSVDELQLVTNSGRF